MEYVHIIDLGVMLSRIDMSRRRRRRRRHRRRRHNQALKLLASKQYRQVQSDIGSFKCK